MNDFLNIYSYFDKFKVNYSIFYDLKQFIHVVKIETYSKSFNLLLMKIYLANFLKTPN
jgi:hypothetical protein